MNLLPRHPAIVPLIGLAAAGAAWQTSPMIAVAGLASAGLGIVAGEVFLQMPRAAERWLVVGIAVVLAFGPCARALEKAHMSFAAAAGRTGSGVLWGAFLMMISGALGSLWVRTRRSGEAAP